MTAVASVTVQRMSVSCSRPATQQHKAHVHIVGMGCNFVLISFDLICHKGEKPPLGLAVGQQQPRLLIAQTGMLEANLVWTL